MPKKSKKVDESFEAQLSKERIMSSTDEARSLYDKSRFGEIKENKVQYSLSEGIYLLEKGKIILKNLRNQNIDLDLAIKKATKLEPNFWIRYVVFRDMRDRGYIVKTALKFGADFRVYDRGIKPGEDHAKWILYPVHESSVLTWYEFAAKNRVAHSTRKRLLLGIVDGENDVTYYSVNWTRP
jgi:tRNA-intron endonuclease, archaea type